MRARVGATLLDGQCHGSSRIGYQAAPFGAVGRRIRKSLGAHGDARRETGPARRGDPGAACAAARQRTGSSRRAPASNRPGLGWWPGGSSNRRRPARRPVRDGREPWALAGRHHGHRPVRRPSAARKARRREPGTPGRRHRSPASRTAPTRRQAAERVYESTGSWNPGPAMRTRTAARPPLARAEQTGGDSDPLLEHQDETPAPVAPILSRSGGETGQPVTPSK
ncbi:hypothetical protein ppKF707_4732 [Metapseudomonas furukawaii]|uniref:Uncharacterized protein n=1 Tax=Metapseudomonas furukawaii TaxID=1149133 RepID=A0AAD1FGW8_METFU|nr:hypothetical protein ppKF707_4732 [Pseudomonas furukawaii]BAU74923.1 hypothetical protein KF707C_32350 [Pseudomonas furukawaii]